METFGSKRLREFVDYLKSECKVYNDTDFCNQIGKNRQQVSQVLTGSRPLSSEFAFHVARCFPELNLRYLVDESCNDMLSVKYEKKEDLPARSEGVPEGSPLTSDTDGIIPAADSNDIDRLLKIIDAQSKQIDRLIATITLLLDK